MEKKKDYKGEKEIEGEMEKNYNKLLLFPFYSPILLNLAPFGRTFDTDYYRYFFDTDFHGFSFIINYLSFYLLSVSIRVDPCLK